MNSEITPTVYAHKWQCGMTTPSRRLRLTFKGSWADLCAMLKDLEMVSFSKTEVEFARNLRRIAGIHTGFAYEDLV